MILSRQTLSGTTLNLLDLSFLVTTCFSVQSSCAIFCLSFQAVTLFQVVTKLINRNWFPVRFILKLLSALLVNRRKDTHYWFKLLHQQVKHMPKFTYAAVAGCRLGYLKVELSTHLGLVVFKHDVEGLEYIRLQLLS